MRRQKLSIELFGKTTFWLGLSIGLATTLILYLFFTYGREILRSTTAYSGDLLIPTNAELIAYNLFFAAVSIAVGFGISAWFWFHNPFALGMSRNWNQFIRTYLIAGSFILLVLVSRSGQYMMIILFGLDGYDNHLSLYYEIPELLFLLPTVFFLNVWTTIRLKYRAGKWFWSSVAIYVLGTILLGFSTPIDQSKLNKNWEEYNWPYNKIVDSEIKRALGNGIIVSAGAIETLRFNKKQRVLDLAENLKQRFSSEMLVPTDSIVIELILVKKTTFRSIKVRRRDNQDEIWPFALPRYVFGQMIKSKDSLRTQYLKEILVEYKGIFSQQEKEAWELGEKDGLYNKYENRESMQRWYRSIKKETDKYWDLANIE